MHQKAVHVRHVFSLPVIVAALGYFVDIYDLVLFSIVRVPSLKSFGISGQQLTDYGVYLLNMQIGNVGRRNYLGILGDWKGRPKSCSIDLPLFRGNFANGIPARSIRVAALHSHVVSPENSARGLFLCRDPDTGRGYGTMLVASVGVSGAILANMIASTMIGRPLTIGGVLGLRCPSRISVAESGIFRTMEGINGCTRQFSRCLRPQLPATQFHHDRCSDLVSCRDPITFSPEFAKVLGTTGPVSAGNAVMFCYLETFSAVC
jgi:hypothetical protein